ncbi:dUTP diphosphatase [Paenibacillus bouchesdurhonensis]|uniref:dUTP diphosphatase n=1 Tax=Paenibacillus bouchesdurhonensis TaxID=1870990 RepID=UPI001F390280|nr:dUTP diphosphatase [Paenibacillus bouchesdurhonensis]
MTITLEQMYEMQKQLDARIIKEKGLEGQDFLPNTVFALQVEIGELGNEWRGFKHWSTRQEPLMYPLETCSYCGEEVSYTRPSPFIADAGADMCEHCWDMTKKEYAASNGEYIPDFKDYPHFPEKKPQKLLEEYADCLHFFLSIAVQKGWLEHLYLYEEAIEEARENGLDGGIGGAILEVIYWLSKWYMEKKEIPNIKENLGYSTEVFYFRNAWFVFMAVGMIGFEFTWEQIAEAYAAKNAVNHERQASGY